jgi:hypothetical protein
MRPAKPPRLDLAREHQAQLDAMATMLRKHIGALQIADAIEWVDGTNPANATSSPPW